MVIFTVVFFIHFFHFYCETCLHTACYPSVAGFLCKPVHVMDIICMTVQVTGFFNHGEQTETFRSIHINSKAVFLLIYNKTRSLLYYYSLILDFSSRKTKHYCCHYFLTAVIQYCRKYQSPQLFSKSVNSVNFNYKTLTWKCIPEVLLGNNGSYHLYWMCENLFLSLSID